MPIIHFVNHEETGLSKVIFKEFLTLEPSRDVPTISYINVLCHSPNSVQRNSRPNWFGFMSKTGLSKHLYSFFLYWIGIQMILPPPLQEEQPESAQSKLTKSERRKLKLSWTRWSLSQCHQKFILNNLKPFTYYSRNPKKLSMIYNPNSALRSIGVYLRYIELMKDYTTAEKTRNWYLHLATVIRMTIFFVATAKL